MSVFVDTSAFYALLDRDDRFHQPAKTVWMDRLENDTSFVTHNYILVETHALVQSRSGLDAIRRLVDELLGPVRPFWVDESLHRTAVEAHLSAQEEGISLVDRISFLFMRKRGIQTAFCLDADYRQHGFQVLPAEELEGSPATGE